MPVGVTRTRGGTMEALEGLGVFFAGLGIFFIGCGLLWFVSEWKERYPKP
jgi:hypothetical protein